MELTKIYEEEKSGSASGTSPSCSTGWKRNSWWPTIVRSSTATPFAKNASRRNTRDSVHNRRLATPVIMSAMTMPIPAITEEGLIVEGRAHLCGRSSPRTWVGSRD